MNLRVSKRQEYAKKNVLGSPMRIGNFPYPESWSKPKMRRWEVLEFAAEHGLSNQEKYLQYAKDNPEIGLPNIEQLIAYFDDLANFFYEVRQLPEFKFWNGKMTDRDLLQFCAKLKIRSKTHFRKIRLKHPEFDLPSEDMIKVRFGGWEMFMSMVRTYDIDYQIDEYFRACLKAGKALNSTECKKLGINIIYLKQILTEDLFCKILREKETWYRQNNETFKKFGQGTRRALKIRRKQKYKEKYEYRSGENENS